MISKETAIKLAKAYTEMTSAKKALCDLEQLIADWREGYRLAFDIELLGANSPVLAAILTLIRAYFEQKKLEIDALNEVVRAEIGATS